jgi:hypothetical protein
MNSEANHYDGGCTCRHVRYRVNSTPLIVHACHCRWCQRESGTSYALNALIEADRVQLLAGEVVVINTPAASGKDQKIARCPKCQVAVWSNYAISGEAIRFIRVGTLDEPGRMPPDMHIYTESKQPWVVIPPGMPAVPAFYKVPEVWSQASLERYRAQMARMQNS